MTRLKKVATFLLCGASVLIMSVALFACSSDGKEEKYDVAIRVECSDGDTYEFSFGEHEKHVEIPYDGISRTFKVTQYWLKDYKYNDWLDIVGPMDRKFMTRCYKMVDGNRREQLYSIVEPGNYSVDMATDYDINPLTGYMAWSIYITIE